ncbi:MAG: hypothetical protein H8E35_06335 [Ardenticatenia bacterium]|nr:hypothetical protein [Ardenticatenia bacterium]
MNSRERVCKALRFEKPDRVPRDLWTLPAITMSRPAELEAVIEHFPLDIALPDDETGGYTAIGSGDQSHEDLTHFTYGISDRASGDAFVKGTAFVDPWACVWQVGEDGVAGEVKASPLADWPALDHYTPPWELLENANWDALKGICARTDRFVLTPWSMNLFERMQFLRGSEALYMDLGDVTSEVLRLRDMVHELFVREVELWCKTDVDAVRLADDWGAQRSLLISPEMWRQLFKPLYAQHCRTIHDAGKFVFFHSDGYILDIIPDLIEIGVNALNCQLFCMDIEELGRRFKGKITFWGEIDRQWVLPFGKPEDVRQAVRRVRQALEGDNGAGVIAQMEWGKNDPQENVEAAFETWLE